MTKTKANKLGFTLSLIPWIAAVLISCGVNGQTIKINSDLGPVPSALVEEAAWEFKNRLGINMDIVGTSHVDCEYGHIIVRRAGAVEWAGFGYPSSVFAVSSQCGGVGWGQLIWHPTKPFHLIGLTHELGHNAGCWQELAIFDSNVMYGNPIESALTVHDTACITATNWWPRSGGDPCYARLADDMSLYIPSIGNATAGYKAIWLDHVAGNDWAVVRTRTTSLRCPGNVLNGPVATFDDIRGYGMVPLNYGRMRDVGGSVWRLEAAR